MDIHISETFVYKNGMYVQERELASVFGRECQGAFLGIPSGRFTLLFVVGDFTATSLGR